MKHKTLETISMVLLVIGGICFGLVGVFNFEPISTIFNSVGSDGIMMMSPITRLIYVLIGLSALYRIFMWVRSR